MITELKLSIYEQYNGFVGAYIFSNGDLPNDEFDLMDWSLIDELIGDVILLRSGKLSDSLSEHLLDKIRQKTESSNVIDLLNKIAERKVL